MLSKMSFGPDRQNLAADAMIEMIRTLGAEDLFSGSSDDERRSVISWTLAILQSLLFHLYYVIFGLLLQYYNSNCD